MAQASFNQETAQLSSTDRDEESFEREVAVLKSQPCSTKRTSARTFNSSRVPLSGQSRKSSNDDIPNVHSNDGPFSRPRPQLPVSRVKSFQYGTTQPSLSLPWSSADEISLLRSYKVHLDQVLRKDAPTFSDLRIPNYSSIDDVLKANEQLLVENNGLRSELNRLKTESTLILRSMRATNAFEPHTGNERISAERERQELVIELARQAEENKRLRKSLIAQSEKFVKLRQSINLTDQPQASLQAGKDPSSIKSAKSSLINGGSARSRTSHHGLYDLS